MNLFFSEYFIFLFFPLDEFTYTRSSFNVRNRQSGKIIVFLTDNIKIGNNTI